MREILFRGKDTETGEWRYSMTIARQVYNDNEIFTYYIGAGSKTIDGKTLGQYTGLTDKNGKQIFEGDIVKGIFLHMRPVNGVVIFQDGAFGLEWMRGDIAEFTPFTSMWNVEYEVIGNIHDNPELLKGAEQ